MSSDFQRVCSLHGYHVETMEPFVSSFLLGGGVYSKMYGVCRWDFARVECNLAPFSLAAVRCPFAFLRNINPLISRLMSGVNTCHTSSSYKLIKMPAHPSRSIFLQPFSLPIRYIIIITSSTCARIHRHNTTLPLLSNTTIISFKYRLFMVHPPPQSFTANLTKHET